MNKLKEATTKLSVYLNRDGKGLSLLKDVISISDEQRKKLASCSYEKDSIESCLKKEKENAAILQSRISSLQEEVLRLKSICMQNEKDIKSLKSQVDEVHVTIEQSIPSDFPVLERTEKSPTFRHKSKQKTLASNLKDVSDLFNDLRRDMRICPRCDGTQHVSNISKALSGVPINTCSRFELSDICKTLSNSSLLTLGRFVAVNALFNLPVVIKSDSTVIDAHMSEKVSDQTLGPYVRWLRNNIDFGSVPQIHCDGRLFYP